MFRQHGRSADTSIVHIILYMPLIFFVYQTLSWKLYTIINVCANNFGRWLWCRYLLKIILQFNLSGAETPNCQRTGIVGRCILECQLAKKVHLIEGKINTCCYCVPLSRNSQFHFPSPTSGFFSFVGRGAPTTLPSHVKNTHTLPLLMIYFSCEKK